MTATTFSPSSHFSLRRKALIGGVLGAILLLPLVSVPAASAQVQGVGMAITPAFPPTVVVGQTGVPAQLRINNNSEGVGPVTLTEITLNPACEDPGFSCAIPDLQVLALSPAGLGSAGSCLGVGFTIVGPDANGRSTFMPMSTVVLQPTGLLNSNCVIDFTFSVLKAPTGDADASAGLQTRQFATTTGFAVTLLLQTLFGDGSGTSITTIALAPPQLTTRASAQVPVGSPVFDTAILGGGFNPTGTITFQLFGPNNTTCSGTPIFTTTRMVAGNGDYVSNEFTTSSIGTHTWIATYSGDANNLPAGPTVCNDPLEQVQVISIVTTPPPPPVTTTPPVTIAPEVLVPPQAPPTTVPPGLVRTGSSTAAQVGVALLVLVIGAQLVAMTMRRREGYDWLSW